MGVVWLLLDLLSQGLRYDASLALEYYTTMY